MRCALQVLRMLHAHQVYDDVSIDVLSDTNKTAKRVVATDVIPAQSLMLPPCAPKTKQLSANSVHPHRVAITVTTISRVVSSAESESSVPAGVRRQRHSQKLPNPAVAETAAAESASAGPTEGNIRCCSRSCGIAERLHILCGARMARATGPIGRGSWQ